MKEEKVWDDVKKYIYKAQYSHTSGTITIPQYSWTLWNHSQNCDIFYLPRISYWVLDDV